MLETNWDALDGIEEERPSLSQPGLRLLDQSLPVPAQLSIDGKELHQTPDVQIAGALSGMLNPRPEGEKKYPILEFSNSGTAMDLIDGDPPAVFRIDSIVTANSAAPSTGLTPSVNAIQSEVVSQSLALDLATEVEWIAKLQNAIEQISATKSQMSFRLKPINLGELHVEIISGGKGDLVKLSTDNENTKAIIMAGQSRLESDIRLSGIKVARIDVAVQSDNSSPSHSTDLAQQNEAGNREAQKHNYHRAADNKQQPDAAVQAALPEVTARFA